MSLASVWSWTVEAGPLAQLRADRAIPEAMKAGLGNWTEGSPHPISRSQVQRLADEGQITAGSRPLVANALLPVGTIIRLVVPSPRKLEVIPEARELQILYEDEDLLVVNKPPGLTVHPSPTQMEGTLVHALLHHAKDLSGIGGVLRPGIVHRLDKDTSGALVVSKSDRTHQALVEIFSRHEIERRYWAICYGCPGARTGRIESLLGRNPNDRKKMSMTVKEGKSAITDYQVLEAYGVPPRAPFASWIEARLHTGRTHQLRVHLTGLGHSLLGDPVYGVTSRQQPKWTAMPVAVQAAASALPGQALHARILGFTHPVTGVRLRFEAEPPAAFRLLQESLAKYR